MTDLTLETLRAELAPIRKRLDEAHQELVAIRPHVDGLPLIWQAIEAMRHEMRLLRAAINDMARVNITAGEVEALHADVDKAQSGYAELGARLATIERRLEQLEKERQP